MSLASLIKIGSLRGVATAIPATSATGELIAPPKVARVATVAVATTKYRAANDPAPDEVSDPDRWCYPVSAAMNTAEIEIFTARLVRFVDHGLTQPEAECMADRLVNRDRERDDRAVCLECCHLVGHGAWRCGNWRGAGVAIRSRDAQIAIQLATQLQRCDVFTALQTVNPVFESEVTA